MAPVDDPLLAPLFTEEDRVGREAVDAILARGPAIGPALAGILRDDALWEDGDSPAGWAVIHAAYLLAALKPPGALDLLLEAVERALDVDLELIGEAAPHLLGSFGPDALPALRAAATDVEKDPYARVFANEAVALIGWVHPEVRAKALGILRESVDNLSCDQDVRSFAAAELLDFTLPEDRERIRGAIDDDILTADLIDETYEEGGERREVFDWMTFYDPEEIERRQSDDTDEEPDAIEEPPPEDAPPPPLKAAATPGRNDPCSCGSGKKYKKCCGR